MHSGGFAVALQGSIDTFALDDVLRLVASTGKTGRLSLRGSRGQGELVVRDGLVLDGEVSTDQRVGDLYELVFELLRFDDGDFQFDAVAVEGFEDAEPVDVDGLIHGASELLSEWRDIERVVPGPTASVRLQPESPGGTVKIDPSQWRLIASVGAGAGVGQLSERLDLSHLATGRLLRSLVDAGLLTIDEASLPAAASDAPAPEPAMAPPVSSISEPVYAPPAYPAPAPLEEAPVPHEPLPAEASIWGETSAPVNGNGNGNGHGVVDPEILFDRVHEPVDVPAADHDAAPVVDAAEFARRLAELPPRAAKAVAAAARATTAEERDAALAELDGTGEEVDHDVLLQLLGPVDS